jgi:hypothetical protein
MTQQSSGKTAGENSAGPLISILMTIVRRRRYFESRCEKQREANLLSG